MIRNVYAVCMKKRIVDKLDAEIPPSQAAYRAGRSTAEHVFAAKVLVEKAITSANYPIHLLMLDVSLRYRKLINADARADAGFVSRRATHHKRTNQHSTQNPVRK